MGINKKRNEEGSIDVKVNLLDKIANMINKYGIRKVISALLILILLSGMAIILLNQKVIVEKIITEQKEVIQNINAKKMQFRVKEVNPRVDAILYKLLVETGCDRAYVVEMHNGTDNPSGLPFVYGDMTYERTLTDSIQSIIQETKSLNLSLYPMATYLMTYKTFTGTMEEAKELDKRFGVRFGQSGAKYVMLYCIRGTDVVLGWIGISYISGQPKNMKKSEASLLDASQRLSILLDINSNIEGSLETK